MASEIHYGLTRQEYASRRGKHVSCFDNKHYALCGNGSFHALMTRDESQVDCEPCRKLLNLPQKEPQ